jgi:hypothetical protein
MPDPPYEGAPCEGSLRCEYPDEFSEETWTFECRDGAWDGSVTCEHVAIGGTCPVPPFAEVCRDLFSGTVAGATIALGPPDEARSFSVGEMVPIVWGGQGSPMITFRLNVTGGDELECVNVRTTVSLSGETGVMTTWPVKIRCGRSLSLFRILPLDLGEARDLDVILEAEVTGVGTTTARLKVRGGVNLPG